MKKDNLILIKKASGNDIKEIVNIHKKCVLKNNAKVYSSKTIKEWLKQISEENILKQFKNTLWFIIKSNQKTMGFCQFSLKEKILYQINIHPDYQNKNLGKRLYDFVENYFKKKKINKIFLNSTLNARKFYKNLGFKSIKNIKFKLNNECVNMVKMSKDLK